MSIGKNPFLLPYYSTVFLLFCSLHCLPPMFMFDPLSSLWSPGRPVEPMSVWRLSALHPPALLAEVDQWARLLDLRALLLPLPRHRYQHEEAVAGKQGWFHPKTAADFMGRFRFCLKLPQLGTLFGGDCSENHYTDYTSIYCRLWQQTNTTYTLLYTTLYFQSVKYWPHDQYIFIWCSS